MFWDKDRIIKWKSTIFQDPQNPDTGVEACFNLISLNSYAHDMWGKGVFALKPLALSNDHKELTVQFFWQPQSNYKPNNHVDLLTEPIPSVGLNLIGDGYILNCIENDGSDRCICSGDIFNLTTNDPEKRPLPSMDLLEMQRVLQCLMGMCSSAGWPSLEFEDNDMDNYLNYNYMDCIPNHTDDSTHTSYKKVHEWIPSLLLPQGFGPDVIKGDTCSPLRVHTPTTGLSIIECP